MMTKRMHAFNDFEEKIMEVKDFYIEFFKKTLVMDGRKSGFDFTLSEIKALGAFRGDKDYTMGELSKNAQVAMPSMTEMVDKLEKHGIAERYRDENDRRVVKVRLTSEGKRLRKEFMQKRLKEMKEIFGKLSEIELNDLIESLRRARRILEKVEINLK
ncbi:MAG: MarR family transcriptional regulator [Deltaproteobacteria bacterium]|nr:MarR family transcriptional regulator [Deltaproteobacteria bacterium]